MLTPSFKANLSANPAATGGTVPGQPMTPQQLQAWIGSTTAPASQGPVQAAGGQIASQFGQGVDQVKQAASEIAGGENPIKGLESGLKAESGVATAVTAPLAPVMKPIGDAVQWLGDKIGNVQGLQDWVKQNPQAADVVSRIATDLSNAGNVAGTIVGADQVVKAVPKVAEVAPKVISQVKEAATPKVPTPEEIKAENAPKIQRVADEWSSPTVPGKASNPASFNSATKILAKSPETPKFLAEQGLSPAQHIENGKYATADTASALRDTAGQMSVDALRPSLQAADYGTPKMKPSDVLKQSIENIKRDPNIEATDAETVQKNIQKRIGALERKYPDGMSLTNMLDESITYAKNGGYKPTSIADNNAATANRIIGSTLGDALQKSAPKDLPVAEFRKYQSQYYKAADYLDALNNKKAPQSLAQYVAHRAAQVTGAAIGHSVGGGILGGVGGYMIGGALEHAIENMALPMRDAFLKNLKVTRPDVYSKVVDYLGNEKAAQATRLALPEGKAPGTAENPIQLGSGADTSGVKSVPAKTTLPTANPKTGRMQRTYTSTP